MKRILIADDDFPIRDWLANSCREILEGEDVDICTAGNGEAALREFEKKPADIVFADIKMPVMDGLELTAKIRETGETAYIIVLSSYDDFNYARSAFKNKVNEYVLKTEINREYMGNILERAENWLEANKEGNGPGTYSLEQIMEEYDENADAEEKLGLLKEYNIKIPTGAFFCMANYNIKKRYESLKIIQEDSIHKIFSIRADKAEITCFSVPDVDSMLYRFQKVHVFIKKIAKMNGSQIICYGKVGTDAENILNYITEVFRGLSYRYYSADKVFYTETIQEQIKNYGNINEKVIEAYMKIIEAGDKTNYSEITAMVSEWISLVCKYKILDMDFVKHMAHKIYGYLEVGITKDDISENINAVKKIDNIEKAEELKDIIIGEYMNNIEKSLKFKADSSIIQNALKYIYTDYAAITGLAEVADYVGLSKEYFSRLFKEEMGVNFSVFLNNYRLDMAKDMLVNTDKKLYEIAEETGFSSLSYFSRKFKEKFDKTPFAFRK